MIFAFSSRDSFTMLYLRPLLSGSKAAIYPPFYNSGKRMKLETVSRITRAVFLSRNQSVHFLKSCQDSFLGKSFSGLLFSMRALSSSGATKLTRLTTGEAAISSQQNPKVDSFFLQDRVSSLTDLALCCRV